MPDPARDLYSFLRSKDFISDEASEQPSDDDGPRLRAVEDFESDGPSDPDPSSADAASASEPESLSFSDDAIGEKVVNADEDTLNSVDFGIIQVDDNGTVQFFNKYESELSGVDPSDARGKNFFSELAPCSNNRLFRGRFKDGVRKGELDEQFTYTYTYKMRPTLVEVRLCRSNDGRNWIFVQKR